MPNVRTLAHRHTHTYMWTFWPMNMLAVGLGSSGKREQRAAGKLKLPALWSIKLFERAASATRNTFVCNAAHTEPGLS